MLKQHLHELANAKLKAGPAFLMYLFVGNFFFLVINQVYFHFWKLLTSLWPVNLYLMEAVYTSLFWVTPYFLALVFLTASSNISSAKTFEQDTFFISCQIKHPHIFQQLSKLKKSSFFFVILVVFHYIFVIALCLITINNDDLRYKLPISKEIKYEISVFLINLLWLIGWYGVVFFMIIKFSVTRFMARSFQYFLWKIDWPLNLDLKDEEGEK